ncbi:MAG TPA: thymidine phosphorylase [Vicinamibacterales bacterium]|jgi:pyrimidine-nucleoside phosphorylase
MRVTDIIRTKRDGGALCREEIEFFVAGVTDGSLPDYQASALLMAVVLRGMTPEETSWLTDAMVRSGIKVDLSRIPGIKVDKHSTGGVGDKASLILAPLAAACGVKVPMMSGRGLGHTGGTLDKLQSIAGFRVDLSLEEFTAALEQTGVAMIGQTGQIAPADKKLYALRDVTATVESIPLITASIMSKKIAEGIDALVLDVKTGRGAFMKTVDDSRRLARSLVDIGNRSGVRTEAFITAMDAPLGAAVGNALEVIECVETLKGRGPKDLEDLSVLLAARMVLFAGIATTPEEAERRVRAALTSGAGVEKWREIVAQQGGDPRTVDDYSRMPSVTTRRMVTADRAGFLSVLDAELVGRAGLALGAGRSRVDDQVDPAVGAVVFAHPGDRLAKGDPILELHYRRERDLPAALDLVGRAIEISEAAPTVLPLVIEEVK